MNRKKIFMAVALGLGVAMTANEVMNNRDHVQAARMLAAAANQDFEILSKSKKPDAFDFRDYAITPRIISLVTTRFDTVAAAHGFARCTQKENGKNWPTQAFGPMHRQSPDAKFMQYAFYTSATSYESGSAPLEVLTYATKCPATVAYNK